MSVTTVFLDLYQTLAYFHPPREERQALVLKEFGLPVEQRDLYRGYLAADHYYTLAAMESPLHLLSPEARRQVYYRYQQVLMEEIGLGHAAHLAQPIYHRYWELKREFSLFPDVEPALTRLREEGYRLGLITNVTDDPTQDLDRVGIRDRFDAVLASCHVGCEKPDPRIFQAALQALKVSPEQAVHVGDQLLADVEGATGAGLRAILLDRYDLQADRYPHRIRSLIELAPLLRNGAQP